MSRLDTALNEYLAIRRTLGFELREVAGCLRNFVTFLGAENTSHITTELALRWATRFCEENTFLPDVKEYADAGHSFMNNKEQFWFKLLRFAGIAYNEPAAMDARRRITAFFHTTSADSSSPDRAFLAKLRVTWIFDSYSKSGNALPARAAVACGPLQPFGEDHEQNSLTAA
jgi:hypothetical protein